MVVHSEEDIIELVKFFKKIDISNDNLSDFFK